MAQRGVRPTMDAWSYLTTFFYSIKLLVKVPGIAIQWQLKRRKAKNHFKNELIAAGIPKNEAADLADMFPFKFRDMAQLARGASQQEM